MKRKRVSKAPRRRPARRRWKPYGGLVFGPLEGPHGSSAAVFLMGTGRRWSVMALSTPTPAIGMGTVGVLDDHAHAVIAEDVRSLAEAKRLGEAWAKKFRKGLVLAPCECEDMREVPSARGSAWDNDVVRAWTGKPEAGAPSAADKEKTWPTRPPIALLPASGASPAPTRLHATSPHDDPAPSSVQVQRGGVWLSLKEAEILDRRFGAGVPSATRQPDAGDRPTKITHANDKQRVSAEPRTFTREGTPPKPGVTAGETAR